MFPIYYLVLIAYTAVVLSSSLSGLRTLPFYYVYLLTISQLQSEFSELQMLRHTWSFSNLRAVLSHLADGGLSAFGAKAFRDAYSDDRLGLSLRFVALRSGNAFLIDAWLGVQVDALAAGAVVAYALRVSDPTKCSFGHLRHSFWV